VVNNSACEVVYITLPRPVYFLPLLATTNSKPDVKTQHLEPPNKRTNKTLPHTYNQVAPRNNFKMGAVVSCIESLFQTIGACLMAIVNGIASVLQAIIGAIAAFFDIIISCLTCGRSGGRRRRMTTSHV